MEDVVLITGCSKGGLGHALALAFANEGCTVVATARLLASLEGFATVPKQNVDESENTGSARSATSRGSIETLQLDVNSQESREQAVARVLERHGHIDILVNNAGIHCIGPVAELPLPLLQNVFNTNVIAPLSLIQAVVPQMIAQRKGKIVNIGSVAGFSSGPWSGGYSASKSAIHALSDSLRVELKPFGVHVVVVTPGAIKSNIAANAKQVYEVLPPWKFYQPWEEHIRRMMAYSQQKRSTSSEEFATVTVKAVLADKPKPYIIVGHLSWVLTLLHYLPYWMRDFIYMRMFGLQSHETPPKQDKQS